MTKEIFGFKSKFLYFLESETVSNIIFKSRVTAIPTQADSGVLSGETVAKTAYLYCRIKLYKKSVVIPQRIASLAVFWMSTRYFSYN